MLNQQKNNELVSLNKDSIGHIHRGSEYFEVIEQVVLQHEYESKSISVAQALTHLWLRGQHAILLVEVAFLGLRGVVPHGVGT